MALRAAILLLLPALALAQTATLVTSNPTGVNRETCTAGTKGIVITWNSSAANGTDKFRLHASGACPDAPNPGNLGTDISWNGSTVTQSQTVALSTIKTATGVSCTGADDTTFKLCVYLVSSSTTSVGSADFKFLTAIPPPPVEVSASPASGALVVSFKAGTKTSDATVDSAAYRVDVYDKASGQFVKSSDVVASTSIRVSGLANEVTYKVRVYSFTSTNVDVRNQSATYAEGEGTPQQFDDFWTRYKSQGGQEEGGCGTAGGGALSPLLLALVLLRRRQRS